MKKYGHGSIPYIPFGSLIKHLLVIKMTIMLVCLFSVQTFASRSNAQEKVSLNLKETSLKKVFKKIENQTTLRFVYNDEMLPAKNDINVQVQDEAWQEAVRLVLKDTDLNFKLLDGNLVVITSEFNQREIYQDVVRGLVLNPQNEPLVGVSVLEKGTSNATATNEKGEFAITVTDKSAILVFKYLGYITMESSSSTSPLNIILQEDSRALEDIVVVGYGTQKKSDLTGSISSVKGEDLTQLPTQRVDQALQGRAAGVLVLNTAGAPGSDATIRVRGMNSITGGNNALIVIDGLQGGNLNSLNPNDIAGIEILKDASATAIYGSQGANGVILVTTKSGNKGKPIINYSFSLGAQNIRKKLDVMNAADYAKTRNAYHATENLNGTPTPFFTDAQIQGFEQNGGTDWQDVIYRTAPIRNHQLSIGGGTDDMKYMVSGGYLDQDGILVNSSYKRFSLRANFNADISKHVSFGLNWAGTKEAGSSPPYGGGTALSFTGQAVNIAPRWDPTTPVYDAQGLYSQHPKQYGAYDTWNPLAAAKEPDIANNTNRNNVNAYLEFNIIEGLKLKVTGGATIRNINNKSYYNSLTWEGQPVGSDVGYGTLDEGVSKRYQNSNILTYDKDINELHHITLMAVAEQQFEKAETSGLIAQKFTIDQTGINDLGGAGQIKSKYSNVEERVINSYLGRLNYSFANRYLLTASFRADGSSVFGKNNKWGYFPSVSLAWRLVEEEFIQSLDLFSDLKLRGSYGITGNQAINPYQTLSLMSSGSDYPYNGGESSNIGFIIANAPNPNLKWESTAQSDIGLDVGLFKGRLLATVDVYKKKTEDLLLNRTLPAYSGLRSIIDNVGSVENKGVELSISGDPLTGTVKWNSGFNISWNRNKVLNLGENKRIDYRTTYGGYGLKNGFMQLRVDEPFGQMYGYGYEGTWKQSEAAEAAAFGQLPGDPRYTDVNKDGKINVNDIKSIGNASPDFIFGWNNRLSYNAFELIFQIQGTKGNDIFNEGRIRLEQAIDGTSTRLLDRWTPENQNTDVPAFIDQITRRDAGLVGGKVSFNGDNGQLSRWVEDGSYLRLKNVTLGYTIPAAFSNKVGIGRAKVYVSGTNLLTFTKYTGYDPEVSAYNGNDAQIGVDLSNYPTSKTFTCGIDISF